MSVWFLHSSFQDPSCSWDEWWTQLTKHPKTHPGKHTQTPTLTLISWPVFIYGPTGGSTDTSGRGTIFLYISVNKILIHVFTFCLFWSFIYSIIGLSFLPGVLLLKWPTNMDKNTESHLYRALYLHGPSQCKIETLFMEILTKRPFSTEHSL